MPEKLDYLTPTLMTILYHFLENPNQEYHEREVIRITKVSKGSANTILRKLAKNRLLIRQDRGKMAFYRLNTQNPVTRQLKILANIQSLTPLLEKLKEHTQRVTLFGSCAEGNDTATSDIDLLIITDQTKTTKKTISDYNNTHTRKISQITVDPNQYSRLKKEDPALHENIQRGITLWQKT